MDVEVRNFLAKINQFRGYMERQPYAEATELNTALEKLWNFAFQISRRGGSVTLTAGERTALLRFAAIPVKRLVKIGAKIYLVVTFAGLIIDFVTGKSRDRTLTERFAIIEAHILKKSSPLVIAFSALEQGVYAITNYYFPDGVAENVIEFVTDTYSEFFPNPADNTPLVPFPNDVENVIGLSALLIVPQLTIENQDQGADLLTRFVEFAATINESDGGAGSGEQPINQPGHLIFGKIDP